MGLYGSIGIGPIRIGASTRIPTGSRRRQVVRERESFNRQRAVREPRSLNRYPILKLFGAIIAGLFLVLFQIGMFGAHGFWAGMGWLVFQIAVASIPLMGRRQRLHAELAARADYEHSALSRGDLRTWMHGQYQPPADL